MNAFCPVTDKRINENVTRLNAVFTLVLTGIFVATQNIIPIVFLATDFLFRAFDQSRYSLIAISSRGIAKYLSLSQVLINAGPKIFAARIGLIFSILILISYSVNLNVVAFTIAVTLVFFSFLEAAFGICVACRIYPFLYRIFYE